MAAIKVEAVLYLDVGEEAERDLIVSDLVKRLDKIKNFAPEMNSYIKYHVCRHDEGLSCVDEVVIL